MDFFDDVEKPDYEKNVLPTNNDDDDSGSAQESENNNAESSTGEQDTKKVVAEKKKPGPKPKKAAAGGKQKEAPAKKKEKKPAATRKRKNGEVEEEDKQNGVAEDGEKPAHKKPRVSAKVRAMRNMKKVQEKFATKGIASALPFAPMDALVREKSRKYEDEKADPDDPDAVKKPVKFNFRRGAIEILREDVATKLFAQAKLMAILLAFRGAKQATSRDYAMAQILLTPQNWATIPANLMDQIIGVVEPKRRQLKVIDA